MTTYTRNRHFKFSSGHMNECKYKYGIGTEQTGKHTNTHKVTKHCVGIQQHTKHEHAAISRTVIKSIYLLNFL